MKHILYYPLFLLTAGSGVMNAQNTIQGKVIDTENNPIDGVAVVLQTADSTYVDAIVTDSLGQFLLNRQADNRYRLLFRHLLYEPEQREVSTADAGMICLRAKKYELDGVVVKAERPQVKVENGVLRYDVPQLMKDKSVGNAFEVVKQIPGVVGTDDALQLLGAGNTGVILNGQLTTMSVDQLIRMLKTIPASRVQKVEVMYNAPARFHIKGALINVVLDEGASQRNTLQGEVGADYLQKHYAAGKVYANLLYSTSRLDIDFLVDGYKGREFMGEEIMARHTLKDQVTEINQIGRGAANRTNGTIRLGADYKFENEDKLSVAYYLNPEKSNSARTARTVFEELQLAKSVTDTRFSQTARNDKSTLHNIRLQYDGDSGIMAGADFTRYHSPMYQTFLEAREGSILTDLKNNSHQDISQYVLFINHNRTYGTGWVLNYGVHGGFSSSKTSVGYLYNKGNGYEPDLDALENNRQKEYSGNGFMEVSKSFGDHLSATVSLKAEYFKSDYTSNRKMSTLWNEWAFFPNASLSYMFTSQHILQLNVNSEKTYPSYWEVTPQATPLNSYSVIMGNPTLKPSRSYEGQLLYILNQKYTLMAFCSYNPDYFAQLPYQSTSELRNIFRFENIDYQLQAGVGVIVPFRVSHFLNSRLTVTGVRWQDKASAFHDLSFNNTKYMGQFILNNTFTLSPSRPNLKLDLNGYYITGAVQGIYDLGYLYDVSAALKWQFANDRAILMLKCNNIFRSNIPHTMEIDQKGQYSRLTKLDDQRCISASFIWKFGGYKKKEHKTIDASRFGKS